MLSKVNVGWFWSELAYTICSRWSYHLNWDNKIWTFETWEKINCVCHAVVCWHHVEVGCSQINGKVEGIIGLFSLGISNSLAVSRGCGRGIVALESYWKGGWGGGLVVSHCILVINGSVSQYKVVCGPLGGSSADSAVCRQPYTDASVTRAPKQPITSEWYIVCRGSMLP